MTDQTRVRLGVLGIWMAIGSATAAGIGQVEPPSDLAAWQARRVEVRAALLEAIGGLDAGDAGVAAWESLGKVEREGCTLERVRFEAADGHAITGVFALPPGSQPGRGLPAVLYLRGDGPRGEEALDAASPEGRHPAVGLALRGFAALCVDPPDRPGVDRPFEDDPELRSKGLTRWGLQLRDDRAAFDRLAARPEVDGASVAATGTGLGSLRALWLMALDERVACGIAPGRLTRFADRFPAGSRRSEAIAPWVEEIGRRYDLEHVLALCAPRPLQIMTGDREPEAPAAAFPVLRDEGERVYRLYGREGNFTKTLFGDLGPEFTLLSWDMMGEWLDKHFLPQVATPLGHDPEPEPAVDTAWVDPAAHGLAGWVAEMSQRPTTWTWSDGVITCAPTDDEYGWLRCPVELADFELSADWRVPEGGNTGIFVRARPVPWFLPPSEANKTRVATRGLDWPSRTGLEVQSADDSDHPSKYSSGSLYRHAAPSTLTTKPAGEWNRTTIRARGPRVEVWINGVQVLDDDITSHPLTLRRPPLRGFFGLQNHGAGCAFRNVRYRALESATAAAVRGS